MLDLVGSLVDQSLLRRDLGIDREPRYQMLETVREDAFDRLEESGEAETMRERHADYFVRFAEAAGPYIQWQRDTGASMRRLNADVDNLRAATVWAAESGAQTTFLRLAAALQHFWKLSGRAIEGRVWIDRALATCESAPPLLRSTVLREGAWYLRWMGDRDRAVVLGERGLALAREHGDTIGVAFTLTLLGWLAEEGGHFARARAHHEEALALGRSLDDPAWTAWSLRNIGAQAFLLKDPEVAQRLMEEALAIHYREDNRFGIAHTLADLSEIAMWRREYVQAAALRRELLGESWDVSGLTDGLEGLAEVAMAIGKTEWAARLLGAAEVNRERVGTPLAPRRVPAYQQMVADLQTALDESAFAAIWAEGRHLSPDEARAEAIRVLDAITAAPKPETTNPAASHGLTPRELEVVQLIAEGNSNQEIAAALFISHRTVTTHVTHIFTKLNVDNRAAVAAYAVHHRLNRGGDRR